MNFTVIPKLSKGWAGVHLTLYIYKEEQKMRKNFVSSFLPVSLIVAFIAIIAVNAKAQTIYYSFNQDTVSGDTVKDLSGNGNDGVLKTDNLKLVAGKFGDGMQFPGDVTDYISVKNHYYEADNINGITLAAWVKTAQRGMIASWDRSEFFRFAVGDDQLDNNDFVAFDTCCDIHDWHGKTKITDDNWHHVCAIFDGKAKKKRIYVDGKLDAEVDSPHAVMGKVVTRYGFIGIGSEAATFDAGTGPTWAFNGIMDDFVLYDKAISEAEVGKISSGEVVAVAPAGKVSLTWGEIKASK
jgi:hypothetical protein